MPAASSLKRIRWSNGQVDMAYTWQGLLDRVRKQQWHSWTEEQFRIVLGKRTSRWSGYEIDIDAKPAALFRQLAEARLIEILGPYDDDKEEF